MDFFLTYVKVFTLWFNQLLWTWLRLHFKEWKKLRSGKIFLFFSPSHPCWNWVFGWWSCMWLGNLLYGREVLSKYVKWLKIKSGFSWKGRGVTQSWETKTEAKINHVFLNLNWRYPKEFMVLDGSIKSYTDVNM